MGIPTSVHAAYIDGSAPASHAVVVTPSDTVNLTDVARALYVGVTGNITVVTAAGEVVLFSNVPVGILPVMVIRVNATATTATNMIALY